MGHIRDLTLSAFAYLRLPLAIAAFAFGMTAAGIVWSKSNVKKVVLVIAAGMVLFVQAARIALDSIRLVSGVVSAGSEPGSRVPRDN